MPNSRYKTSLDDKHQILFPSELLTQASPHPARVAMEPRSHSNNAAPLLLPVPLSTVPGVENIPVPTNQAHQRCLKPFFHCLPIILLIIRAATDR